MCGTTRVTTLPASTFSLGADRQPYLVRWLGRSSLVKVLKMSVQHRSWAGDPPQTYYTLQTQRGHKLVISECEGHWYFGWWIRE